MVTLQRGTVVRSGAGRDKGKLLAVMEATEETLFLCDGKERPVERPKRKNPRHVTPTGQSLEEADLLCNRPLRKALRNLESTI